jgi:hypothetical protein
MVRVWEERELLMERNSEGSLKGLRVGEEGRSRGFIRTGGGEKTRGDCTR